MSEGPRSSEEVAATLELAAHSEGGFFRETYRSPVTIETSRGPRSLATSILYLVDEQNPSRFHRLASDEMWYFHAGSSLEMLFLEEGSERARSVFLGPERPQQLAPAGVWMAARPGADAKTHSAPDPGAAAAGAGPTARSAGGTDWTLVGCLVSPGFEYADFEKAARADLLAAFPEEAALITALT